MIEKKIKEIDEQMRRKYESGITTEDLILWGVKTPKNGRENQPICLTNNLKLEKQGSYYILGLYEECAEYDAKPIRIWVISEGTLEKYQVAR